MFKPNIEKFRVILEKFWVKRMGKKWVSNNIKDDLETFWENFKKLREIFWKNFFTYVNQHQENFNKLQNILKQIFESLE